MEYSFPRYLLAKQSVDDRALNKDVLATLKASLSAQPLSIIEVGGGVGTMLARLLRWELITHAKYTLVDEVAENIYFARSWLPNWAAENGLQSDLIPPGNLHIFDDRRDIRVQLLQADMFDFIQENPTPADLLIAHAVLDLLPMPESLPRLFTLTQNLAWLTVNFDGVTSFEPAIDPKLESEIETLYHQTMDSRPTGGDSQTGRHLFAHLKQVGAEIISAGASDWVVYPVQGRYPDDEAYFLGFILHFFEESLGKHPDLDKAVFANWLYNRRAQIKLGELVYVVHQMDFLVKV